MNRPNYYDDGVELIQDWVLSFLVAATAAYVFHRTMRRIGL
jgi:hypothetical protein